MASQIEPTAATKAVADVAANITDTAETVQKAAVEVTKTVADAAVKAVAKPKIEPAAKSAKPRRVAKPARRVRALKPAAKAVAAKAVKTRVAKPARRAKILRQSTAAPAANPFERTARMTTEATNFFANLSNFNAVPGADRFQSLFANSSERSQEAVRRSTAAAGEFADIAKANVEAFVSAGKIAASGAQSLGHDVVARSRVSVEQAAEAVKSLAEAKSPTEFFQLQSDLAKASFDRFVADGSRLTESVVKLAGEAIQPISNRASLNAERITSSINA